MLFFVVFVCGGNSQAYVVVFDEKLVFLRCVLLLIMEVEVCFRMLFSWPSVAVWLNGCGIVHCFCWCCFCWWE